MSDKDFISKCKEEMKMNTEIKMMKNGIGDSKTKLPTMEAVIHTIPNISHPGRNYGMKNGNKSNKRLADEKLQELITTESSTTGKENIKVDVTKINGKYKINMQEEFDDQLSPTNSNQTTIPFVSYSSGDLTNEYEKIMEEERLRRKEEKRLRRERGGAEPFSSTGKTTPPTRLRGQRNSKKAKAQKLARRKNRK
jgi:hypothetical protein